MNGSATALEMRGIRKSFFGNEVLHGVDLEVRSGEVHAIVGENGAGKSTLMKVLAGVYQPDDGTIVVGGEERRFTHTSQSQDAGVSIIFQELSLLPYRSVAQNIFLGREPQRRGVVDARAMERETAELLARLRVEDSIRPGTPVAELSVAQQQMVEIAKALSLDARIIVMDEPTAPLSPHEVESLFGRVEELRAAGLAIIYISHRLEEIFRLADRITVLKDGSRVDTVEAKSVTSADLVHKMVGRRLDGYYPPRGDAAARGDVRIRVRGGATDKLAGIDLDVHAGEIVGIAGLEGSGRTELARAIFGVDPLREGTLEIDGVARRIRSPQQAIAAGMGFLTEDRKVEGLVLPESVTENALLALRSMGKRLRRRRSLSERGTSVPQLTGDVDLRAASLDLPVQYLSGGNQQKVVLVKWLATQAQILLFDEPTRGIDVGGKAGIHDLMRTLANDGAAILMISSELPEVIGMSDRIVVMRRGRIAGELPAGATEAEIMLLATGERVEAGVA